MLQVTSRQPPVAVLLPSISVHQPVDPLWPDLDAQCGYFIYSMQGRILFQAPFSNIRYSPLLHSSKQAPSQPTSQDA